MLPHLIRGWKALAKRRPDLAAQWADYSSAFNPHKHPEWEIVDGFGSMGPYVQVHIPIEWLSQQGLNETEGGLIYVPITTLLRKHKNDGQWPSRKRADAAISALRRYANSLLRRVA